METKTGTVGTGKGAVDVNLGFGSSKPVFFSETTSKGHDAYHARHAAEMGFNMRQWKQAAADLLNDAPRENYFDWEIPGKDSFSRFDTKKSLLAVGDKAGTINTYFILDRHKYKYYLPNEYLEKMNRRR